VFVASHRPIFNPNLVFLYPNEPTQVATTIEAAINELSKVAGEKRWKKAGSLRSE
jgi:hypothetical protein